MNQSEFLQYLKENNKKQIIFDFDKTLCHLLIDWSNWREDMKAIFVSYGVELDSQRIDYAVLRNNCIKKFGAEARDKILKTNLQNEQQFYSGYDLYPATPHLLQITAEVADLYLWTSNDQATIIPLLAELGLVHYFQKIVTCNDVKYIKPSSDGFALIYDSNRPKSEYLFIGDSKADRGAAANSDIDFLHISEISF